jgi:hypothetical protein
MYKYNNPMPYKDQNQARQYRIDYRERNKQFIREYLSSHPCTCGVSDIRVLEFDHIDPKTKKKDITKMVNGTPSLNALKEEIAKCQVLCANCHRIKTIENKDWKHKKNQERK